MKKKFVDIKKLSVSAKNEWSYIKEKVLYTKERRIVAGMVTTVLVVVSIQLVSFYFGVIKYNPKVKSPYSVSGTLITSNQNSVFTPKEMTLPITTNAVDFSSKTIKFIGSVDTFEEYEGIFSMYDINFEFYEGNIKDSLTEVKTPVYETSKNKKSKSKKIVGYTTETKVGDIVSWIDNSKDVVVLANDFSNNMGALGELMDKNPKTEFRIVLNVPKFNVPESQREHIKEYAKLMSKEYLSSNEEYQKRLNYVKSVLQKNVLSDYENHYKYYEQLANSLIDVCRNNGNVTIAFDDIDMNTLWNSSLQNLQEKIKQSPHSAKITMLHSTSDSVKLTALKVLNEEFNIKPEYSISSNKSALFSIPSQKDSYFSIQNALEEKITYVNGEIKDNAYSNIIVYLENSGSADLMINDIKYIKNTSASSIGMANLVESNQASTYIVEQFKDKLSLSVFDSYNSYGSTKSPVADTIMQLNMRLLDLYNTNKEFDFASSLNTHIETAFSNVVLGVLKGKFGEEQLVNMAANGKGALVDDMVNSVIKNNYSNGEYVAYIKGKGLHIESVGFQLMTQNGKAFVNPDIKMIEGF